MLTALIDEAFANNLDLRGALARIEAARALLLLAQSNLAPSVNLRGGAARSRDSQSTTQAVGQPASAPGNNYSVGIEMSYELDVWGKYRSGALAAANDLVASRYYRETVRITVAADVASAYFRLRAADALSAVLEDTSRSRDRHRGAAARPLRRRHHRRIRPAPGGGRAFRRRRRHRARAAVDRPRSSRRSPR